MASVSLGRRFRAGPLTLIAAMASAIVLGAVGLYYYRGDAANLLYFFYIPVAAASVVLGKRIGICVASFAVAAVAVAGAWRDFGSRVFVDIADHREDSHSGGMGRLPVGHGLVGWVGLRERRESELDTGVGSKDDQRHREGAATHGPGYPRRHGPICCCGVHRDRGSGRHGGRDGPGGANPGGAGQATP